MAVKPEQYARRSFVYPRLVAAGATFADLGDAAIAASYPRAEPPPLGLIDLSPLPRTGIKGPAALAWLRDQGWPVPEADNQAVASDTGAQVLRLGPREVVVLAALGGDAESVRTLQGAIPGGGAWAVPRRDSHAWFALEGEPASDCLAKLCGVDLRPAHFPPGAIAQTSVARITAVVCRDTSAAGSTFHLLADSASALWFWDTLLDAMAEYDGGPLGLDERA
jgi:sarcosine oxidase subunit gamma